MDAIPFTPHLFHQLHDWLFMAALVLAFAPPQLGAMLRHRMWRRRVLSAFR